MSIFSAPSFYSNVDRQIYNAGNYFIPQQQYRDSAFNKHLLQEQLKIHYTYRYKHCFNQGGGGDVEFRLLEVWLI